MRIHIMLIAFLVAVTSFVSHAATDSRGLRLAIKDDQGRDVGYYTGSYALVVGVSRYNSGWPVLESIPDEVSRVENALEAGGFKVTKILDPDSQQLKAAFEDFMDLYGYDRGNRLLFFFAGHGYTLDKGRRGYLVPADAPNPSIDERNFRRRALDMTDIMAWCRKMQANHALFLFDSCFSGTIFKTRDLPKAPPHINALTAKPVRQFISAGTAGQSVPARSVFTPTFLKGLRGAADYNRDKFVTGTELGMYLQTWVTDYATAQGCPQTPQYGKLRDPELDEGDFVFVCDRNMLPIPAGGDAGQVAPAPTDPMVVQYTGTLVVESPVAGLVRIDGGKPYSVGPGKGLKWDSLPVGAHSVAVVAGNKTWKDNVTLSKDQLTTVKAVFGPTTGQNHSIDLGGGVKMEFVWIDAFKMWVGKYEVTNEQYRRKEHGHNSKDYQGHTLNGKRQPVVYVNFEDAKGYAEWLNTQLRSQLPDGYRVRLPSENEFMTYAQCGDGREYPWGNNWPPRSGQAGNYSDSDGALKSKIDGYRDGHAVTCNVEDSWANPWGLYGVGGNVWEVCASDSSGGSCGAWRGASWYGSFLDGLRCSYRLDGLASARNISFGFRVVLSR